MFKSEQLFPWTSALLLGLFTLQHKWSWHQVSDIYAVQGLFNDANKAELQ
jgi:hypothetical protein